MSTGTYDQLTLSSVQRSNDQQKLNGEMALKLIESASVATSSVQSSSNPVDSLGSLIDVRA